MQDEQIEDLKQFIEGTVSQAEERLRTEIKSTVSDSEARLREEIADGFAGVAEAIEGIHEQLDSHIRATEARVTKLEQRAA